MVESMALNVDIPATIVDMAQIELPASYQGCSLTPLIRGQRPANWRTDFFCEHLMVHAAIPKWEGVRGQRWVYARYFDQQPPYEFLHDLQTDPDQLKNLAGDSQSADRLAAMRARCIELRDSYGGAYSVEKFPLRPKPKKKAAARKRKDEDQD